MRNKFLLTISFLIVASMVLSACQTPAAETYVVQTVIVDGEVQEIVVTATPDPSDVGPKIVHTEIGVGDVPTLDPALATDTSSVQVIEETFVGLTRLDEENIEIVPGMATDWEYSEDGKTITFNLRNDVPWVTYDALNDEVVEVLDCEGNPRMVTAQDFAYGIQRTLNPMTGSDYAYVLGFTLEGASAYNQGETDDPSTIGVEVIDDNTLALTFTQEAAYNINIAGMWIADAQPSWIIEGDECTEARGDRWTETGFFQGYGPFVMKEWVHDAYVNIAKNPFWPGSDDIPVPALDEVVFHSLDTPAALAEYEVGNMDYTRVPVADMDRIKTDPILSEQLHIAPAGSTYFYGFNTAAEFVDDPRVRLALSMSVDRQAIIDNVTKQEQTPARWFCPPSLVGCPKPELTPELGVEFNPEKAQELLQDYMDEKGLTPEDIRITLMFNTNANHQRIAEAVQAMWADNLGLSVTLTNQEWKVFLKTTKGNEAPQIYRSGWNLDYPDANNFLMDVMASGGNDNPVDEDGTPSGGLHWYNKEFENKIREAAVELDPEKRISLYAEAEDIAMVQDAVMIPVYWYTSVSLTQDHVIRTYSKTGHQHLEKWDLVQ